MNGDEKQMAKIAGVQEVAGAGKKPVREMSLNEQGNAILQKAAERGVTSNFFFVTTFKRYQVQMKVLSELEKEIGNYGATVQKEYVKGRGNLYVNPAITEYNKTSTAANGTVATLINIVERFGDEPEKTSKLQELMNGLMDDE
jgi:hypothetical protein